MAVDCIGFDTLFERNVPHILEKIFLSLDFDSFMSCQEVNNTWKQGLTSETIKTKAKTVFHKEISKELLNAIECDNPDKVKRFLSIGLVDVNSMDLDHRWTRVTTMLGKAVYLNGKAVIRALLEGGADPNIATIRGNSPLSLAFFNGYTDIISILQDGGAKNIFSPLN